MADDPFPREQVTDLLRRLPSYTRLSWHLVRDPLLSRGRRAAIAAAAGYLVSPIDAIPGVIPVLGQLDDVAVALLAIRYALAGLGPERRQAHLAAAGLREEHLATDLATVRTTGTWLLRAGGRAVQGAARLTAREARGAARGLAALARRARRS